MWGVGCIYFEMIAGRPLFPGQEPNDQLERIFKVLGTPNNRNWPTIMNDITPESKSFLEMKPKLKNYTGEDWTVKAPRLDIYGRDLLSSILRYHNSARISARCAMKHHVFEALGKSVHQLNDHGLVLLSQLWISNFIPKIICNYVINFYHIKQQTLITS
jgi:serine/threonine protein kinase